MHKKIEKPSQELAGVFVVEASAGSGKTYALTQRYLQLLVNPALGTDKIPLRSILAITFTNKATVEMKERILQLLKQIALDIFPNRQEKSDLLHSLNLDPKKASQKARDILEEIIHSYNFFQIKTIDSFINTLLLGCAFNIERSARFSIKKDYRQYLQYCLDLVIDRAAADESIFFFLEEFLQHYLFVENRQGWFPREDILALLTELFKITNKHARLFRLSQGQSTDVIKKKKYILSLIKNLASDMPEGINANAQNSIRRFLKANDSVFNIAALPAAFKSFQPPLNKGKDCNQGFIQQWRLIYENIRELAEFEAFVVYNPYIHFFYQLLGFFALITKKEDVLFLEELNRTASMLFDNESFTVAEAYYRLAARFKHYLIDEFQDTSRLQWDNLYLMIEDALAGGGSLFYVGDRKQAIYRFRGGRVELFDQVCQKFEHFNVFTRRLSKNWRSQKAIVEFNNRIFSSDNIRQGLETSGIIDEVEGRSGLEDIAAVFKDSFQEHHPGKSGGYWQVEYIEEENQEQRDEIMRPKIINLVEELRKRFPSSDIAILTKDNAEVERVTAWLLDKDIPVESEKTLNVMENDLIRSLVALLRFLNSPVDDIAFAAFITSDFFAQVSGTDGSLMHNFLFELYQNKRSQRQALYREFRRNFQELWQALIDDPFRRAGFITPYELCASIYESYKVFERFPFDQAFFMKFLELVKIKEDEIGSLSQLFDYLDDDIRDDFYVYAAESDAVKVLTIHKSKGLEFPAVIIPFLRMDITPGTVGKGTNAYISDEEADKLELVRITKAHREFSPKLRSIYAGNYQKACIDELNALYVALTRAETELYIYIPQRSANAKNKVGHFIGEKILTGGEKTYSGALKHVSLPAVTVLKSSVCRDWIYRLRPELRSKREIECRLRIKEGVLIHAILARIGNCCGLDKQVVLDRAVEALDQEHLAVVDLLKSCKAAVGRLLFNAEFDVFFSPAKAIVFCEKEISNAYGDLKRIDRLVIDKDKKTIFIVDYKLGGDDDYSAYEEQMREYKALLEEIYGGYVLRCFLLYIDQASSREIQ